VPNSVSRALWSQKVEGFDIIHQCWHTLLVLKFLQTALETHKIRDNF
jgi:hypothetical protein